MSLTNLIEKAKTFEKSSSYRHGDRTSFAIRLHEKIVLLGSCSATNYLDDLGLDKLPERVMVVCPGNGGLVAECYQRGARQVVAVEPRFRFQDTLRRVLEMLSQAWLLEEEEDEKKKKGRHHQFVAAFPEAGKEQGFLDFDLILWAEGVDEITTPKAIFQGLADCLNPGGQLVVELAHGSHQWVEQINSWRPTGHAVVDMANEIFGGPPTETKAGRSDTSRVFFLTLPGKKEKVVEAPKPKPPEPKIAIVGGAASEKDVLGRSKIEEQPAGAIESEIPGWNPHPNSEEDVKKVIETAEVPPPEPLQKISNKAKKKATRWTTRAAPSTPKKIDPAPEPVPTPESTDGGGDSKE